MDKIFIIFFVYFLLVLLHYFVLGITGIFENRRRMQEDVREDYSLLSASSFTIPVSIIIPAHNEMEWIEDTVLSALNLNYPEFEVIIVDDGSTDRTIEILTDVLGLESDENPFIDRFSYGEAIATYKSVKYANVRTVISKIKGHKKAGAVNIGLNIARFKYVCVIDADTVLEPDAFLRVMAQVEKSPEEVIGIGSHFGLVNGFKIERGKILERIFSHRPIIAYQNLEYFRSFMGNRLAWSRFKSSPIISGGFGLWRRDILLELGGYASQYSCEDLEFTLRVHEYIVKNKKNYRVLVLPYTVGWTEGPSNLKSLIMQRERWQRVTNEAVSRYRRMLFNPRYKFLGMVTMPYYLFYEVFGVFFEAASLVFTLFVFIFRVINVEMCVVFLLFMILSQAVISLISLFLFVKDYKVLKAKDVRYFVLLVFLESFWYRWIVSYGKLLGMYHFIKGIHSSDQYARESRKQNIH